MTECQDFFYYQKAAPETCPADSDYPEVPVALFDLCVSLIGIALTAVMVLRSPEVGKQWWVGQAYRVVCDHFRFLLIVQLAYDHRLTGASRLLFDLLFPLYNVSLAAYPYSTYPLLQAISLPAYFVSGCTAICAWGLLLFLSAVACVLFSQDRDVNFNRIMLFNILATPDVQMAVSMGFAGFGRTVSYAKGTLCFATSLQWTFFTLIVPVIMAESRPGYRICESDFRSGMRLWLFAVKGMQVGLIYVLHLTKLFFAPLPGFSLCVLLLVIFVFRQMQTTYWPYQSRFLNHVADDTYLSLMLMCLWGRFRRDYLSVAAVCLPLRQGWRLVQAMLETRKCQVQVPPPVKDTPHYQKPHRPRRRKQ